MTLALLLLTLGQLDAGAARPLNLLVGLQPKAEKAANAERMNDGQAPDPGDTWQSVLTSVLEKDGNVTWDFGTSRDFEGVWIQADNNDVYVLSTSEDGVTFTTAWESSTVDNAGMQVRQSPVARGHGRYLRLTAKGGDGMFSIGELAVFASAADEKAYVPAYAKNPTAPTPQPFDGNWVVIAVVLAGIVMLVRRMKPPEAPAAAAEEKKEEPPAKS